MAARYDRRARSYGRCWAPVLAPAALSILDAVEPDIAAAGAASLLDAGTGSGTLAIAACRRWPYVRVTGLDVSAGMLAAARAGAASLDPAELARLSFVEGNLADPEGVGLLPGSFHAIVSSFVLHLVPDRTSALAGLRRLLRPGGVLTFAVWAGESKPWSVETAFERALADGLARAGLAATDPRDCRRAGPIASADAARLELRAAGFADVTAWESRLHHAFARAEARALFVEYDRSADLEALPDAVRAGVLAAFEAELERLPDGAFEWDAPLVAARGVRPPGG
jgi:SAM-dependent methyltransferase